MNHAQALVVAPALLLAGLLALAPAIAHGASGCDDLTAQPANYNVRWPQVWQALNDQAPCTQNCHVGSVPNGGLDFSSSVLSIYFLVGQPSSQDSRILRVAPGDPEASLIVQKTGCSHPDVGDPMPPPFGHLSLSLQALIYDWIAQGALGESPEDPIARDSLFHDSMESGRRFPPYVQQTQENHDESAEHGGNCSNRAVDLRYPTRNGIVHCQ